MDGREVGKFLYLGRFLGGHRPFDPVKRRTSSALPLLVVFYIWSQSGQI